MGRVSSVNQSKRRTEFLAAKDSVAGGAGPYVPMAFQGGPLITAPELVSLYWGDFQQSEIDAMQAYLSGFASFLRGGGAPLRQEPVVNQYGVVGGVLGATIAGVRPQGRPTVMYINR